MAKKVFALEYFLEPLSADPSFYTKSMFGGLAVYYAGLMVFILAESPGTKEYRGVRYDFDIWNGVLVCTSREFHRALKQDFPLVDHPILGKWQMLSLEDKNFEVSFSRLIQAVMKYDERIGIVPNTRKRKKKKTGKKLTKKKVPIKTKASKKAIVTKKTKAKTEIITRVKLKKKTKVKLITEKKSARKKKATTKTTKKSKKSK